MIQIIQYKEDNGEKKNKKIREGKVKTNNKMTY